MEVPRPLCRKRSRESPQNGVRTSCIFLLSTFLPCHVHSFVGFDPFFFSRYQIFSAIRLSLSTACALDSLYSSWRFILMLVYIAAYPRSVITGRLNPCYAPSRLKGIFFVSPTRCGNFVRGLLCFADVSSFKLQCRLHVYQVFTHLLTSIVSCADVVGQKSYSVLCLPPSLSPRLRRSADGHAGLYRRALRNISKWSHSCQRQQQYLNE